MTTPLKQRIIDAVVGAHTDAEVARRAVVAALLIAKEQMGALVEPDWPGHHERYRAGWASAFGQMSAKLTALLH